MNTNPLVSIVCLTYNEEEFVRETIEGFLMQKCNFMYEVLVYDDASTDTTPLILQEYAQKYPNIFRLTLYKENNFQKGTPFYGLRMSFNDAKGKYIALCEGDDYWTDPFKLQKQVDFLEQNPEYGLCCTRYRWYFQDEDRFSDSDQYEGMPDLQDGTPGMEINQSNYFSIGKLPQVHTVMYRTDILPLEHYYFRLRNIQDDAMFYCMVQETKFWVMNVMTGIYRKQVKNSVTTKTPGYKHCQMLYDIFSDIYQYNPTEELRSVCKTWIESANYSYIKFEKNREFKHLKMCWNEYRKYTYTSKEYFKFWRRTLRASILHIIK